MKAVIDLSVCSTGAALAVGNKDDTPLQRKREKEIAVNENRMKV